MTDDEPKGQAPGLGRIVVTVMSDGGLNVESIVPRPTVMWSAAELFRNIGDAMYHEQRMAMLQAQQHKDAEVQRVAAMLRQGRKS